MDKDVIDNDSSGMLTLFEEFYEYIRETLKQMMLNPTDELLDQYVKQINDLIMQKLHAVFWHRNRKSNLYD